MEVHVDGDPLLSGSWSLTYHNLPEAPGHPEPYQKLPDTGLCWNGVSGTPKPKKDPSFGTVQSKAVPKPWTAKQRF